MRITKDITKYLEVYVFVIATIGLGIFLVISALMISPEYIFLARVLEVVGGAAIATGAVTCIHDYLLYRRIIYKYFEVLRGVTESGIENVYPTREVAVNYIKNNKYLHPKKRMWFLGIALTDFLTEDFKKFLDSFIKNDSNLDIRILLLNPNSNAAEERAKREEGVLDNWKESILYTDISAVIRSYDKFIKVVPSGELKNFSVEGRCYDMSPIMQLVLIDEAMFIEIYHLGREEEIGIIPPSHYCLGRRVPIFQVNERSKMYKIMVSHFEYLWIKSKDAPFSKVVSSI